MAFLFNVSTDNVGLHIKNIFKEKELDNSVAEESSVTASDGKTYKTKIYNLDMIISVGFRIKSKRGVVFRRWANKVLKEYLIEGYSVNNKSKLAISSGALTALTLLVAESDPKEKEIMDIVVMNILFNKM